MTWHSSPPSPPQHARFYSQSELIIIMTKMMMTGALSVVEPGSPIQLVFAMLVMLSFTLITLKLAPYRLKSDDWLTFLVSLAVTGNTLAGFTLIMDKDNTPRIFNPENIEALLLFMNITVLVVQVISLVALKCGLWEASMRAQSGRKIKRMCCDEAGSTMMTGTTSEIAPATRIVPIGENPTSIVPLRVTAGDENDIRCFESFSNGDSAMEKDNAFRTWRS